MKKVKLVSVLIVALFGCNVLTGCNATGGGGNGKDGGNNSPAEPLKVTIDKRVEDSLAVIAQNGKRAADSAERINRQHQLTALTPKFIYRKDEFDNSGYYIHKAYGGDWPNRMTLQAYVGSDGGLTLVSNYYNSQWIYHRQIRVKIGDSVMTSALIDQSSKYIASEVRNGGLIERVMFPDDNDIIVAIGQSKGKRVLVRFAGQYAIDCELSAKDITAIRESWELAKVLWKG